MFSGPDQNRSNSKHGWTRPMSNSTLGRRGKSRLGATNESSDDVEKQRVTCSHEHSVLFQVLAAEMRKSREPKLSLSRGTENDRVEEECTEVCGGVKGRQGAGWQTGMYYFVCVSIYTTREGCSTITTESTKIGAKTLSCMNFSEYVGHVTIFS